MKYFTAFFVTALTANLSFGLIDNEIFHELTKAALDDKLKSFLEGLKPILQTGNASLGIPILDPFIAEYQKINISEDNINIFGDLQDLKVDGLSDYYVDDAKFKLAGLKISVNITWASIKIKSLYNVNAKFDDWEGFALFRAGDVRIHVTNFTFGATARLGIKSNKVFVKELSTGLSLKAIKVAASGIYNNEEASQTMSAIVSTSLPNALDYYQYVFIGELNSRLKNLINSQLQDITLQDIINIIG